jgi:hypothetical protein
VTHSPKDDDRYSHDSSRRYARDATRGRKRRNHRYDEVESTGMVAAEFLASRSNDYRKQGREPTRVPIGEPVGDQQREWGREQGCEWQPRKV